MFENVPFQEQALHMLKIHNAKVERIRNGQKEAFAKRQAAKEDVGASTIDEEPLESLPSISDPHTSREPAPKKMKKKKTFRKTKKEVEVEIKVKGEDGSVVSYQ